MFSLLPFLPFFFVSTTTSPATSEGPRARSSEIGWERPFGVGGVLGAPTGISAKVYLDRRARHAIDAALAIHGVGPSSGGAMIVGTYGWHPSVLLRSAVVEVPWRVGAGAYLGDTGIGYAPVFGSGLPTPEAGPAFAGFRGVVGLDADLLDAPVQVFGDLSTQLTVAPRPWWGLGAAIGARYYF